MPSRLDTFPAAFTSIVAQVDRLYLYLDGHSEVPDVAKNHPRVTAHFAEGFSGLHAKGKFLPLLLEEPDFLYIGVDDDIIYPPSYVAELRAGLGACARPAVVGLHGAKLTSPFVSYSQSQKVYCFDQRLICRKEVDVLGTGTVMFDTAALWFDVRTWRDVDMLDLNLAIEAKSAGLPLICLKRRRGFMRALAVRQPDSLFAALLRDDTRQTKLALELKALRPRLS